MGSGDPPVSSHIAATYRYIATATKRKTTQPPTCVARVEVASVPISSNTRATSTMASRNGNDQGSRTTRTVSMPMVSSQLPVQSAVVAWT